jgi:F-type H+-transporting ATPase subunit b
MHFDAEFYVTIGFVLFVLLMIYFGAHKTMIGGLDARARKIGDELAEAKRLREEAASVLASFQKKRADAEAEAQAIVSQAKAEADMLAKETEARMADFVARRGKQAEAKIAQAEAQAMADVRSSAADAAVRAAEIVLRADVKGPAADQLVRVGIGEMKAKMH